MQKLNVKEKVNTSWKCVANKQKALILSQICSEIAQAKPKPSYVDVPRPNSSIIIKDLSVAVLNKNKKRNNGKKERKAAYFKIVEVSNISAINVDNPRS